MSVLWIAVVFIAHPSSLGAVPLSPTFTLGQCVHVSPVDLPIFLQALIRGSEAGSGEQSMLALAFILWVFSAPSSQQSYFTALP